MKQIQWRDYQEKLKIYLRNTCEFSPSEKEMMERRLLEDFNQIICQTGASDLEQVRGFFNM